MTVYISIYKAANGEEFFIEYRPLYDVCAGAIEILSASVSKRPHTWQEQRKAYKQTTIPRKPRQLDLFNSEPRPVLLDEEILSQNPLPPAPEML